MLKYKNMVSLLIDAVEYGRISKSVTGTRTGGGSVWAQSVFGDPSVPE